MAGPSPPILVAPDAFGGELRAPVVAAAIARGLERAGVAPPPDLCPVSSGGRGTIEALLPALGGETGDGFALIEDGGTAIVELEPSAELTAGRLAGGRGHRRRRGRARGSGRRARPTGTRALLAALADYGGLGDAALWSSATCARPVRSPCGCATRAARALSRARRSCSRRWTSTPACAPPGRSIVGERRLDRATLQGRVAGEMATRARQSGVPCHAVVGDDAIDRFDARILDLQAIVEAATVAELEAAGEALAAYL